jgi:quercetin dioxygenase-like cupin family protein
MGRRDQGHQGLGSEVTSKAHTDAPYKRSVAMNDFETFKAQKLAEGYDEVLVRDWAPDQKNQPHTHPFDVDALMVKGEFWLTIEGQGVRHLQAGDRFQVPRDVTHFEHYGPSGAVFWAARKN